MGTSTPAASEASSTASRDCSITVVITTFNDTAYLREALSSVFAQTHPADEVILVDDGSDTSPAPFLEAFPHVKLMRKENGGLASARNAGLHAATSDLICFLDADDRLKPKALAAGLDCFHANPKAAMVFGGHHQIGPDGKRTWEDVYQPLGFDPYASLLTLNLIAMHATVLFRREIVVALGGYNDQLRRGEDYDLYLRLTRSFPVASHPQTVAEYRWHGDNMSGNRAEMLATILSIHDQHRPDEGRLLDFWLLGRRNWRHWYTKGQEQLWGDRPRPNARWRRAARSTRRLFRKIARVPLLRSILRRWPPPLGKINFGSLASTRPVSMDFGWDRGTPIDRYYIDNFLRNSAQDIKGRALEIGDDSYSRQFGTGITHQDILHVDPENPNATIIGEITTPGLLPNAAFDCIIFTQTLQFIFDLETTVTHLHAALKPGGVLLLTVPGISQVDRFAWGPNCCWSFTATSIHRLFYNVFGDAGLDLTTHGNIFAAISFLTGAALEEIDRTKLDVHDPAYPVLITLRAQKL